MQTRELYLKRGKGVIPLSICNEIVQVIKNIDIHLGQYDLKKFNSFLNEGLLKTGWSKSARLSRKSNIAITAFKKDIGLCVQTGNVARTYADLLKLQAMYKNKTIKGAIYIIPQKECAKTIGQNVANFERLQNELINVFHKVITFPMLIVGFNNEETSNGTN